LIQSASDKNFCCSRNITPQRCSSLDRSLQQTRDIRACKATSSKKESEQSRGYNHRVWMSLQVRKVARRVRGGTSPCGQNFGYPFFTRINPPRKALVWRCLRVGLLCTCVLFSLGYGVRSSFQRHLRQLLHEEELPLFSRSSTYPIRLKTKVQRKVALSTRVLGDLHFKAHLI
jgi:hypothetical protein